MSANLERLRAKNIARLEREGELDPDCPTCQAEQYPYYRTTWLPQRGTGPWAPSHRASERCQSGKRPHCTCDTCF